MFPTPRVFGANIGCISPWPLAQENNNSPRLLYSIVSHFHRTQETNSNIYQASTASWGKKMTNTRELVWLNASYIELTYWQIQRASEGKCVWANKVM